jgi:hypothetical protein
VPADQASATIALVGDSHASHWRAALDPVAHERRWRGLSLTHTSCPLSTAVRGLPEPDRTNCTRWRGEIFEWFRRHPEVHTVFAGAISGGDVVPAGGRSEFTTAVSGYVRAWKALPRSVTRILVIRDTPKATKGTGSCIRRALAAHRRPGPACARPRDAALTRDEQVAAATRLGSRRVRTLNLSEFFCTRTCMPVIGGALVYKDVTHVTRVFGRTLGPYLLRAVNRVLPP